jgi:HK97 family phage major capsid protein
MPIMPTASQTIAAEREAKQVALKSLFDAHRDESGNYTHSLEQLEEIRAKNAELTDLGRKYDAAREIEEIAAANEAGLAESKRAVHPSRHGNGRQVAPGAGTDGAAANGEELGVARRHMKSLGDLVTEHAVYKSAKDNRQFNQNNRQSIEIEDFDPGTGLESKATMTTAAGWAPANDRGPLLVPYAQRRPIVADLIPQTTVGPGVSTIKYMEETTATNGATAVAEGGTKPASALAFTEQSVNIMKIATLLPVTDEQLDDVPQVRSIIDDRLTLFLRLKEEFYLLNGTGTTPQFYGFLTKTGVLTQAKGSDPTPDAVYKAVTQIRSVSFTDPDGVIFHPNDWAEVRLLRTLDGIYIWGNPSEAGPERIWGYPVVVTTAMTENTALVGAFRMSSHISRRMGIRVDFGYATGDWESNLQTARAEERLSLEILRASSFAKVTGI